MSQKSDIAVLKIQMIAVEKGIRSISNRVWGILVSFLLMTSSLLFAIVKASQ